MIITIDGPSGTGKSTTAKAVAQELGFIYFDTGAMYRGVTYSVIKKKVNIEDQGELENLLQDFRYDIRVSSGDKRYFVNGEDVTEAIRSLEVTALVSKVAAIPRVRKAMVEVQRSYAKGANAVFEGRDLGTVVFPQADLKIFLTARPEVRAQRRYKELLEKDPTQSERISLDQILADINDRDHKDSTREVSPLRQAADAHLIDTSSLSVEQVVQNIVRLKDDLNTCGR